MKKARQPYPTRRTLYRLDAQRKAEGVTLQAIAAAAAKTSRRGTVTIQTVSRVLHAHTKSANVVATVRRLVDEAKKSSESAA